jgi:hypothetical protein
VPLRPVSELGLVDITDVPARDGNRAASRRHSTRARKRQTQPLPRDSANDHQVHARGDRSKGARASTQRKPAAGRRASKTLAAAPQTSAPAKSRSTGAAERLEPSRTPSTPKRASTAPATPKNSGGRSNRSRSIKVADAQVHSKSQPRRTSASTATSSERSRSRSKAATNNGSGDAAPSATRRGPKRSNRPGSAPRRVTTVGQQTSAGLRTKGSDDSRKVQRSRNGRRDQTKPPLAAKIGISVLMGASLVAGGLLLARAALQR